MVPSTSRHATPTGTAATSTMPTDLASKPIDGSRPPRADRGRSVGLVWFTSGNGTSSSRVPSRYRRTLRNLAACGRPLLIELEVRRFFCGRTGCEREIFAEQVDGLVQRYARRTSASRGLLTSIAIALAGRAGARMAGPPRMPRPLSRSWPFPAMTAA